MSMEREKTAVPPARSDVLGLLWHFLIAYPRRSVAVIGLLTLAGFAEGVSVIALLPFVEVVIPGEGANASVASRWVSAFIGSIGLDRSIGTLLLVIVAGIAVKAAVTLLAMKEVGYAVGRIMTDLRRRLIAALLAARWSYFVGRPLGEFANAIGAETIRAGITYQQSTRLAAAFIQAMVYGAATFVVSWQIALFSIVAGIIAAISFRKVVAAAHAAGDRQTDLMKSLAVRTTDTLQGIKAIKAMGTEQAALPLLDQEIHELDVEQRNQVWSSEFLRIAQEPLLVTFLAVGIYAAVSVGGQSLPTLMVLAVLFYRLFNRFQSIQEIYQSIGISASAYWSVHRLCEETERESERQASSRTLTPGVVEIELASVSFDYGGNEVLRDVSIRIDPGEFVAISGASGGGKSTLLDIVGGLLLPVRGRVLVDGHDLNDIDLHSWRARIGYVPQEMLLLHDTVYRNVSLGNENLSREQVEEALKVAEVWDLIDGLPDGLDTMVGERGSRFSGGQRQRISLARALVRKPALLLLDEITAGLDEETEQNVCATLKRLSGAMTIIAVSHQAEMARVADRSIHLEGGRVMAPKDRGKRSVAIQNA